MADVDIVKRRVDLQFDSANALGWLPGEPVVETFLDTISFFFPAGEKFFIDSVSYYKNDIDDPVLLEQVRSFIYQEAMHTSVHNRCNVALLVVYPQGARVGRMAQSVLNGFRKIFPRQFQLAVSCAIEHYTAMLADSLFYYLDYILERAHPDFAKLWAWHAVEETEHKAVCFDVYVEKVGSGPFAYLMRIAAMLMVTLLGGLVVAAGVVAVQRNRSKPQCSVVVEPAPNLKKNTASLVRSLIPWRLWLDYFKPSFHPWDHDNRQQIELWKLRFPNFGVSPGETVD